ncbi:MAG: 4-hydroxy-2-oxovalerate aldolase [Bacteroidales bacterium]|nr:4-hydroxy-2-oxovalerate aldolase [Bacteroidales bacterium]
MKKIHIHDVSLRDGSHAISHQLSKEQIISYCIAANNAGIATMEVGHGNGIGASSIQVGISKLTDEEMLTIAKRNLTTTKLAIHVMPGFATINKDLKKAFDWGVDLVRVACHCTEADITEKHISFARERGKEAIGALMMTHMASKETLLEEALKMQSYGAEGVVLYDSAGAYLPRDVKDKINILVANLNIPVGFHAHNNLGLAIANSLAAVECGAQIIDGAMRGFGAGAGNAQLEVLVAVLQKLEYETGISLYKVMDAAEITQEKIIQEIPTINNISIISGLSGVFSGFAKHVARIAKENELDPRDIFIELGKRKVVAGQEDLIVEVAIELKKNISTTKSK